MVGTTCTRRRMSVLVLMAVVNVLLGNSAQAGKDRGQIHSFEYSSSAMHDPSAMMNGMKNMLVEKQKIQLSCRGTILTIQSDTSDSIRSATVVITLGDLTIQNNDTPVAPELLDEIQRGVSMPVFVHIVQQGIVHSLSLDSTIHPVSIQIVRNIISFFQVAYPIAPHARYRVQESDPTGSYTAEYRTASHAESILTLTKKKIGYTSLAGTISDFDNAGIRAHYSGTIKADTILHAIKSIHARESKQTVIGSKVIGNSTSSFRAVALPDRAIDIHPVKGQRYSAWHSLDVDVSALKMMRLKYERILGTDDELSILHRADSLQNLGVRWDDIISDKLEALLNLRQDSCPLLYQFICEDSSLEFTFQMISLIMAESATKIGEKHLLDAMEWRKNDPAALDQLLPLMVYIEQPSIRTEQIITRLAFGNEILDSDSQRTAQLALGTIARNLLPHSLNRAESITNLIITKLGNLNDSEQYLAVLGNTGSTLAIPEIMKYYNNGTIQLRCLALKSLRFIPSRSVDSILKMAAKKTSPTSIRNTALDVQRFRKFGSKSF